MKEKEFINIIKKTLNSQYIGDDCAYLKELNIVVTQDSLVEGVHFVRNQMTAYQLGCKSVSVNISDILASGAEPAYLTIALSLPEDVDDTFIKEFYKGAKHAACGAKIVGGDITGSNKIFISITAIGKTDNRRISSRSHARVGQKIVVEGMHGSSAVGLKLLNGETLPEMPDEEKEYFMNIHKVPRLLVYPSKAIATTQKQDYAMMDTSDGLADALFAISEASGVMMEIDFDKIPCEETVLELENCEEYILYGGEDYGLVATVDDPLDLNVVGEVKEGSGIKINYEDSSKIITKSSLEGNLFDHFKE